MLKSVYARIIRSRWELGFVKDGLEGVFSDGKLKVDWVINPFRDRWFADPFVLDVTDSYVYVLAEEFQFNTKKEELPDYPLTARAYKLRSILSFWNYHPIYHFLTS